MKKISLILVALFLLPLTACGASNTAKDTASSITSDSFNGSFDMGFAPEMDYVEDGALKNETITDNVTNSTTQEAITTEKLVYRCTIKLETLNYEQTISNIKSNILKYKGIIENESEWDDARNWYYENYVKTYGTKNSQITIRIPTNDYENFLSSLDGLGKVLSKNSSVENITKKYYETDTYIKALEKQQERLLEMMNTAYTIEDMITVEERLTDVQYQLNNAKNQLSTMDKNVEYSTITLQISEVLEYSKEESGKKTNTFFDRLGNTIKDAFSSFFDILEFLLFAIIRLIPIAIIFTPIIFFIIKLIKKIRKRKK